MLKLVENELSVVNPGQRPDAIVFGGEGVISNGTADAIGKEKSGKK